MKNYIFSTIMMIITASGAFAANFSLSAGAGGLLGYTFTRYNLTCEGNLPGGDRSSILSRQSMDRFNYGGFIFFDATYAEISVMFQGGYSSWAESVDITPHGHSTERFAYGEGLGSEMSVGFSLAGKYPFAISEKITLFPLLGAEYRISLRQWRQPDGEKTYDRADPLTWDGDKPEDRDKNGNPYPLSAWNSIQINVGAGFDYTITGPLYLRGELIFGFRLMTGYETGALETTKTMFSAPDPRLAGLTGGPDFRIGLGYRF